MGLAELPLARKSVQPPRPGTYPPQKAIRSVEVEKRRVEGSVESPFLAEHGLTPTALSSLLQVPPKFLAYQVLFRS
jgi:hypothetical protein